MRLNRTQALVLGVTALSFSLFSGKSLKAGLIDNVSTGLNASERRHHDGRGY
jgi:hypothetical protein